MRIHTCIFSTEHTHKQKKNYTNVFIFIYKYLIQVRNYAGYLEEKMQCVRTSSFEYDKDSAKSLAHVGEIVPEQVCVFVCVSVCVVFRLSQGPRACWRYCARAGVCVCVCVCKYVFW